MAERGQAVTEGRAVYKDGQHPTSPEQGSQGPTLAEAQEAVDRWISGFEEGYWPPLANLARLTEEVGELARELNHLYGSKPKKEGEAPTDLALELGDILFVLIALANEQGIDLGDALGRALTKYEVRDAGRWTKRSESDER